MAVPRNTPMASEVRFTEIRKLLEKHGWEFARVGSNKHYIFTGPGRPLLSIPVSRNKVKIVYKRKVEKAIRELEQEEDDA